MTLAGSIVWNVLILAAAPVVMLAYPLSDEIIRLVIVLVFIHNLFNAAAFPASGALIHIWKPSEQTNRHMESHVVPCNAGILTLWSQNFRICQTNQNDL